MLSRVLHFLTPTFAALIAFGLIVGVANLLRPGRDVEPDFVAPGSRSTADLAGFDLTRVVLPGANLLPEEVVRLQLAGLGDPQADGVGILQCFCFASPANRAVTGPLERFGAMVRQGAFGCLARPRALLVGQPQYEQRVARVLVTVVDEQSQVRAFTFVLARQQEAPVEDCWMTEAVLPAIPPITPQEMPPSPAA